LDTLVAERPVGRKKKSEVAGQPPFITVKIARSVHAKLAIIASEQGRDLSDLLTEIASGPVDKLYKQTLARLNQKAQGEA
jgi:hypothetical protein